jgi:hypothetical protein
MAAAAEDLVPLQAMVETVPVVAVEVLDLVLVKNLEDRQFMAAREQMVPLPTTALVVLAVA